MARVTHRMAMGEMTASIVHEINQPLAAIASNASAGLRWLTRATPNLDEVHGALDRIVNDSHRASEVIGGIPVNVQERRPSQGSAGCQQTHS